MRIWAMAVAAALMIGAAGASFAQSDGGGVAPENKARAAALVKQALDSYSDRPRSIALFEEAAALGHLYARGVVGANYCKGDGVPKDIKRCHSIWLLLAEEGHPLYQSFVGQQFMNGYGVERDYDAARYWLEKAANQGDADAMGYIGMIYDPASKMQPNMELAVMWKQLAHEKGNATATLWLKERNLLKLPPNQQAFIDRIESQGPDRSSAFKFGYDVAIYCQYDGKQCDKLRAEAMRMEERENARAEAANMQRIWNIYRREGVDPSVRTACLRKATESLHKATYGQQSWYYSADNC